MSKDLKQEFLQLRIDKARDELKRILDKHQLLLSAELQYSQGAIIPIVKLVERNPMSEENQPIEAPAEQPAIQEAAPEAQEAQAE